jgi:hypothetical protein
MGIQGRSQLLSSTEHVNDVLGIYHGGGMFLPFVYFRGHVNFCVCEKFASFLPRQTAISSGGTKLVANARGQSLLHMLPGYGSGKGVKMTNTFIIISRRREWREGKKAMEDGTVLTINKCGGERV